MLFPYVERVSVRMSVNSYTDVLEKLTALFGVGGLRGCTVMRLEFYDNCYYFYWGFQ